MSLWTTRTIYQCARKSLNNKEWGGSLPDPTTSPCILARFTNDHHGSSCGHSGPPPVTIMSAMGRGKPSKDPKPQYSGKGRGTNSPSAMLASTSGIQSRPGTAQSLGTSASPSGMSSSPDTHEAALLLTALEIAPEAITKPILAAIEGFKSMMMVRIDHLASECTLIRHDFDKMRGRITEAEDWISTVEDQQGSHTAQIAELQSLVSSLMHKMHDTENMQRQNNIRVVGLMEGAEGQKPEFFCRNAV